MPRPYGFRQMDDAREVAGWKYEAPYDFYDSGADPDDLAGRGAGSRFVLAGLDFARERFVPKKFTLSVPTFNRRAIRDYEHETNGGTHEFPWMSRRA